MLTEQGIFVSEHYGLSNDDVYMWVGFMAHIHSIGYKAAKILLKCRQTIRVVRNMFV